MNRSESLGVFPGWDVVFLSNCNVITPSMSGGDKHFIEIARVWRELGQELSVITPAVGKANYELEGLTGPFRQIPFPWIDRLGIVAFYLWRGLSAFFLIPWRRRHLLMYSISDILPDVFSAFLARLIKRRSSFWVVCVFHLIPHPRTRTGSVISNYLSYKAQRLSLKMIKIAADVVIVDNQLLRNDLMDLGISEQIIFKTSMGATMVNGKATAAKYAGCFVGRLHPTKGIFELVEIWKLVCDTLPESRLAIVGSGTDAIQAELVRRVSEHGMNKNIDVMGYLPQQELEDVFSSSKLFLFPSHEEGFGIGILEAMAHNLPIIAYSLPHYEEIFDTALVTVGLRDVQGFAKQVLNLLSDESYRLQKAIECNAVTRRYSWVAVAQREAEAILKKMT